MFCFSGKSTIFFKLREFKDYFLLSSSLSHSFDSTNHVSTNFFNITGWMFTVTKTTRQTIITKQDINSLNKHTKYGSNVSLKSDNRNGLQ